MPSRISFQLGATQTDRHHRREDADARDRRIGHGGDGALRSAQHPRHDQRGGPGHRRHDREKCRGMKRAGARPQDDQHADQTDHSRDPAAQADAFAEKEYRQCGDEQRRDEAGGGGFRDGQKPQAGNKEQRRRQQGCAAHQVQAATICLHRIERRTRQHRRDHDQCEHQKAGSRRSRSTAVSPTDISRSHPSSREIWWTARISAMPRNGRSARAGATGAAIFFSGKGNGMLSSLAAAADGGVKAELGRKLSNWVSVQKMIFGLSRQGPKTGSRYARLRAAARRSLPYSCLVLRAGPKMDPIFSGSFQAPEK